MSTLLHLHRRLACGLAALTLAVVGLTTGAPAALADNPLPVYPGSALEGADPVASGCSRDAQTADSTPITGYDLDRSTGQMMAVNFGTLNLRYSPRCGTNWAQVVLGSPMGGAGERLAVAGPSYPAVARIEGGNNQQAHSFVWQPPTQQFAGRMWSDMVYAPTMAHDSGTDAPNCARARFAIVVSNEIAEFTQHGYANSLYGTAITGCF